MADLNSIGGIHYEMMRRCYNEKSVMYSTYGAVGITVCEEWHDRENFRKWALENGYKKGLRLNRIDSRKGYSPNNCLWGTKNSKDENSANQKLKKRIQENKEIKQELGIINYTDSPLYVKYRHMLERCYNPKDISYPLYGGRGIDVCQEWQGKRGLQNFIAWANKSGYEDGLSLDRIDNDKGYCPENCRWVSMEHQAINKRRNKQYDWNGQLLILSQIAKFEEVSYGKLYRRINDKNMTVKEAIEDIKKCTE